MSDTQHAKNLVLKYLEAWESAPHEAIDDVLGPFVSDDYSFRGVHPFNELSGIDEVSSAVWRPMREAFTALQRRQDIFMAGENRIDGTLWVTSMGKLMGLFDRAWLGIPPTRKIALIPYCEFHRVDAGRIAESAFFCDIVSVMKQAGLQPAAHADRRGDRQSRPPDTGRVAVRPPGSSRVSERRWTSSCGCATTWWRKTVSSHPTPRWRAPGTTA